MYPIDTEAPPPEATNQSRIFEASAELLAAYEAGAPWTNIWSLPEAMALLVLTAVEDSLVERIRAWDASGRLGAFPDALDAIDVIRKMAVKRSEPGTVTGCLSFSREIEPETIRVPIANLREVKVNEVEFQSGWDGYETRIPRHHLVFSGETYGRGQNTPEIVDGQAEFSRLPCDGTNHAVVLKAIVEGIIVEGRFWEISDQWGQI